MGGFIFVLPLLKPGPAWARSLGGNAPPTLRKQNDDRMEPSRARRSKRVYRPAGVPPAWISTWVAISRATNKCPVAALPCDQHPTLHQPHNALPTEPTYRCMPLFRTVSDC